MLIIADNLMADFKSFYSMIFYQELIYLKADGRVLGLRKALAFEQERTLMRTVAKFILPELLLRGFCGWPVRTVL